MVENPPYSLEALPAQAVTSGRLPKGQTVVLRTGSGSYSVGSTLEVPGVRGDSSVPAALGADLFPAVESPLLGEQELSVAIHLLVCSAPFKLRRRHSF